MKDHERFLVENALPGRFRNDAPAVYASIQNYRRFMAGHNGVQVDFQQALESWCAEIKNPILRQLEKDIVIRVALGKDRSYNLFFPVLYETEERGFRFNPSIARKMALRRAEGLRNTIAGMLA